MSRAWTLTTNTKRQLADVSAWLQESGRWSDISIGVQVHRLIAKSSDSSITLICSDVAKHRPGSAKNALEKIQTPSTLILTQELSRAIDHCGRLDEIYQLAFSFAKWDSKCDLYFELEDHGIFKRVQTVYTVNPDRFFAKSLACMLTFPYTLADSDKRDALLVTDEGITG